ncbi:hypothetical protein AAIB33_08045 [Microbacterium sp. AZCO]|uniref:hypothetical protein n=1 Tax=Microbacterium sp. AZCO TaxID=3142976 RepID=UPI0031F36EE0
MDTMRATSLTGTARPIDPMKENPVVALFAELRREPLDSELPNGGRVRAAGRARTAALIASGLYG